MTALHWAAYHGDPYLANILCASGAKETASVHGYTPVDIAGFCNKKEVVYLFAKNKALVILKTLTML